MSTSIEKVPGIGPTTAVLLAEHGILSAEDLAAKQVGDLAAIKGFNTIRSGQVIEAARLLAGTIVAEIPVPPGKSGKKDKGKKVEKKKKKDKEKNKDLKKKSAKEDKKKSTKAKKSKDKKKSSGSKKKTSKKK
ncbi:MAG: helix-hairpin-helix domain-containing protein [Pelovirga sp.]